MMEKSITIAGAGMGSAEGMTEELLAEARQAELIIGAERVTDLFKGKGKRRVRSEYRPEAIRRIVDEAEERRILILVTGDQGFFSAAEKIRKALSDYSLRVLPGISSVSYLSAGTGIPYSGAALVSAHGRQLNLVSTVRRNQVTYVLAGGNLPELLERLCVYGYSDLQVYTGENLAAADERIRSGSAAELLRQSENDPFARLSLMLVLNPDAVEAVHAGIPDEEFIRGAVPMTRREVRALILSSLRIKADSVVMDIGSGTGSVAVEAALSAYRGTVYAVEKKKEALELIRKNAVKFHADNIRIAEGEAPEVLDDLPAADLYFIGGSGGKLREILKTIQEKAFQEETPEDPARTGEGRIRHCRVVISALTLQTLSAAQRILEEMNARDFTCTQLQASRSYRVGNYDMLKAENPVFVITAEW